MPPIGRNSPCPCLSGKKYKKCHGLISGKEDLFVPLVKNAPQSALVSLVGLPGYMNSYMLRSRFPPGDPRNDGGNDGLPGLYSITFVLSRPGTSLTDGFLHPGVSMLDGDSHLRIAKPKGKRQESDIQAVKIFSEYGPAKFEFTGYPNENGFLGKVEVEVEAANFDDARFGSWHAHHALATLLSTWSLRYDIPFVIAKTEITETRTGSMWHTLEQPFSPTNLASLSSASLPDSRPYTSLYREAVSTNSSTYQFLCLYKILESVRERRARLNSEAKLRGIQLNRPKEIFPSTEQEMNALLGDIFPHRDPQGWSEDTLRSLLLPELKGKKFNGIFDDLLRPIRNVLAHAILDEGELKYSPDSAKDQQEVIRYLPAVKCVVRSMLRSEFPDQFDISNLKPLPSLNDNYSSTKDVPAPAITNRANARSGRTA